MSQKTLSVIIPCYNESENLEKLIKKIQIDLDNINYEVEVILVNNGSVDDTQEKLNKLLKDNKFIRHLNIKKNIGYGNGVLEGLSQARNNFFGWTHADLQCEFNDCLKGFEILYQKTKDKNINYLLKGKRLNRNFLDSLFTKLMSIFIRIFCKVDLEDINAQPKIFPRKIYNLFKDPPKDFLLDFYLMKLASENNYEIYSLDVNFSDRKHGKPKGGGSILGKFILSIKTAYYVIKYQNGNNNT